MTLDALVFYVWDVRSISAIGCVSPWRSRGFVYFGRSEGLVRQYVSGRRLGHLRESPHAGSTRRHRSMRRVVRRLGERLSQSRSASRQCARLPRRHLRTRVEHARHRHVPRHVPFRWKRHGHRPRGCGVEHHGVARAPRFFPGDSARIIVSDPDHCRRRYESERPRYGQSRRHRQPVRHQRQQSRLSVGPCNRQRCARSYGKTGRDALGRSAVSVQGHAGGRRQDVDAHPVLAARALEQHLRRRLERQPVRSRRRDRVLLRCDEHQRADELLLRVRRSTYVQSDVDLAAEIGVRVHHSATQRRRSQPTSSTSTEWTVAARRYIGTPRSSRSASTPDRYDVRGPSSSVSNRPGTRVKDVATQLNDTLPSDALGRGDLTQGLGDGTGAPEKSNDYAMVNSVLGWTVDAGRHLHLRRRLRGGTESAAGASAITFKSTYLTYTLTTRQSPPDVRHLVRWRRAWPVVPSQATHGSFPAVAR